MYGLEENSSYDCNYKDEIEDVIKLVSWHGSPACLRIIIIIVFVISKTLMLCSNSLVTFYCGKSYQISLLNSFTVVIFFAVSCAGNIMDGSCG